MSEHSVWQAGWNARAKKRGRDACPYPVTSMKHRYWIEGYRCADEPMQARG